MSGVRVRRYRPGDGERGRELNRVAMRETPEWVADAPDEDLEDVRGHYLDADGEFLVGELGSDPEGRGDGDQHLELVAMGAYSPLEGWMAEQFDGWAGTVELTRIRVAPEYKGRGFGSQVVTALERRARRVDYRALALNTGANNDQARAFYESLGYSCVRTESVAFDDITLELALYYRSL